MRMLFACSVKERDESFFILTLTLCPGKRSKELSLKGRVDFVLSILTNLANLLEVTHTLSSFSPTVIMLLNFAFGKKRFFPYQKEMFFCITTSPFSISLADIPVFLRSKCFLSSGKSISKAVLFLSAGTVSCFSSVSISPLSKSKTVYSIFTDLSSLKSLMTNIFILFLYPQTKGTRVR